MRIIGSAADGHRRSPPAVAARRRLPTAQFLSGLLGVLVSGVFLPGVAAGKPEDKLAPDLQKMLKQQTTGNVPVIVQTTRPINAADQSWVAGKGGRVRKTWSV